MRTVVAMVAAFAVAAIALGETKDWLSRQPNTAYPTFTMGLKVFFGVDRRSQ